MGKRSQNNKSDTANAHNESRSKIKELQMLTHPCIIIGDIVIVYQISIKKKIYGGVCLILNFKSNWSLLTTGSNILIIDSN